MAAIATDRFRKRTPANLLDDSRSFRLMVEHLESQVSAQIDDINAQQSMIAASVEEQTAATAEISASLHGVASAADSTLGVLGTIESAGDLSMRAFELQELVQRD